VSSPRLKAAPALHAPAGDAGQARFNLDVRTALAGLLAHPFAGGRHLPGIAVGTAETAVPHYLGRVPVGWFATGVTPTEVDPVYQSRAADDVNLYLICSRPVTAGIFVF